MEILRPYEAFARLGLACLVVLLVCAPTALGALEDPKAGPEKLWEEFPLNPTGERLGTLQHTPQRPVFRPPVATQAVKETATPGSEGNALLVALVAGAGLLALAIVGFVSVRVWRANHQPERRTLPLLQYAAWSSTSSTVVSRQRPPARPTAEVETGRRGHGEEQQPWAASTDRIRRLYRRRSPRGFRPRDRRNVPTLGRIAERVQHALWNGNTIPVYVGSVAATLLALLIVHWAG